MVFVFNDHTYYFVLAVATGHGSVLRGRWAQAGRMLQLLLNDQASPETSQYIVLKMIKDDVRQVVLQRLGNGGNRQAGGGAKNEWFSIGRPRGGGGGAHGPKDQNAASPAEVETTDLDMFNWSTLSLVSHILCKRGDPQTVRKPGGRSLHQFHIADFYCVCLHWWVGPLRVWHFSLDGGCLSLCADGCQ